ncbi:MAG: hypothetical protein ACR2QE_05385 [Acidimicrobiales bacterium]
MTIKKFADGAGFVAIDLDGADRSVGIVRQARKILQGGAQDLARSLTYTFASMELPHSGASAGISAEGDSRDGTVAAFTGEIAELVSSGQFLPNPGKGVSLEDLGALVDADPRSPVRNLDRDGVSFSDELAALSTAVAAERFLDGLEGQRVAIEGFETNGVALGREFAVRGARLVAVQTAAGTVADPEGLDAGELAGAWTAHGPGMVEHVGPVSDTGAFAVDTDILVPSSKIGCLNHGDAATVTAGLIAPGAAIPVTARALATLRANDQTVLPDFLTQAGPVWAWEAAGDATPDDLRSAVTEGVRALIDAVIDHDDGPFLAACYRAEAFLGTWQETLPFGRPLAA